MGCDVHFHIVTFRFTQLIIRDSPDARCGAANANELEAAEPEPAADGPLALAARGEADVVLPVDVDGQAERETLDAPRGELELI